MTSFANPWGLLGLLALPTILAIHLFHRRFLPLEIASLHLWGAEAEMQSAGRQRERLQITLTLLLELAAALLLTLVISRPRLEAGGKAEHLVAVLDNSASMSAVNSAGEPLRELAVQALEERLTVPDSAVRVTYRGLSIGLGVVAVLVIATDAFLRTGLALTIGLILASFAGICGWNGWGSVGPDNTVATIIVTGRRPSLMAGPGEPWTSARKKLDAWQPFDASHDMQPAWDLAAQWADESSRLVFVTDRMTDESTTLPTRMEVVALGESLSNVAITMSRWRFDAASSKGQLALRVTNFSESFATVKVWATSGETRVDFDALSIPPHVSVPLESEIPGGLGTLKVELSAPSDRMQLDSVVTLIEPKIRPVTVVSQLPEGSAARKFTDRVLRLLPGVQSGKVEQAHLLLGPAEVLPASRDDLWWVGFVSHAVPGEKKQSGQPLAKELQKTEIEVTPEKQPDQAPGGDAAVVDLSGPFLIERRNPLLDGITLDGVVWGGARADIPNAMRPLVRAGKYVLFGRLLGTRTTAYLLNIDLNRTNLTQSPDWPILISNIVQLRRNALPGLRRWNYRLNERIGFRLFESRNDPAATSELPLILRHGTSAQALTRTRDVEVPTIDKIGVYELLDGEKKVGRFSVNFHDPGESDLTKLNSGHRAAESQLVEALSVDTPYNWVIMAGLILTLIAVFANWRLLKPSIRP